MEVHRFCIFSGFVILMFRTPRSMRGSMDIVGIRQILRSGLYRHGL
jgi:hypothetical protein